MPGMIEVIVDSVRVSLMSPQRIVLLRQKDLQRYLPIWVGPFEAESITAALNEIEVARPLTHDLLRNVFAVFQSRVVQVEIVAIKGDIFYGNLVVEKDGKVLNIDSRPSDAIALGVRVHVPILVNEDVMDTAAIVPETDLREERPSIAPPDLPSGPPAPPANEGNLDIFEDFLKKLDDRDGEDKPAPGA